MKPEHLDRITKMEVHIEYKCAGRIATLDVALGQSEIVALRVRQFIDEKMAEFINAHETNVLRHPH